MTFCLLSGDVSLFLGIPSPLLFVIAYELICCESFEIHVILLLISLPIKSQAASADF